MKNVYFSHGTTSEQRLYEDLIIESLQIYGFDVYYLPREFSTEDRLFHEDPLASFDENYIIEMYVSNYEGFTGEGTLLTRFGVRIAEEITFIVSKRRWEDLISSSSNLLTSKRPNEGDVIYFPLTSQLYQIKFVEHNKPFRQLGQIATYQLVCEVMEDSGERFDTGISEIDNIRRDEGYSITFDLFEDNTTGGIYTQNETVTGSISGAIGKNIRYDNLNNKLELIDIVGTFVTGDILTGNQSGAEWACNFSSIENDNDDFNENQYLEEEGDKLMNWNETNPFGEYFNMGEF